MAPSQGSTGSRSRRSGTFSISGRRNWASTRPWSSPTTRSLTPAWPNGRDFFARGLLAAGLKPGETVGILLPNCADAIAALFGAAKAGLYPVPVNARYKSLELADLIRHSRMRLLFISPPDPRARRRPTSRPCCRRRSPPWTARIAPRWPWTTRRTCARSSSWARAPRPASPPRPTSPRPRPACQTATCSAAASWSRSATPPWSCTPPAPRPSRRARCSATRP